MNTESFLGSEAPQQSLASIYEGLGIMRQSSISESAKLGEHVYRILDQVHKESQFLNEPLEVKFNGIKLVVSPEDSWVDLMFQWERQCQPKELTPEEKWEKARKEESEARRVLRHVDFIRELVRNHMYKFSLKRLYQIAKLLVELEDMSGPVCWQQLAADLEFAGFKKNAWAGPREDLNTAQIKLEYIIGQVINFMSLGYAGHQMCKYFFDTVVEPID